MQSSHNPKAISETDAIVGRNLRCVRKARGLSTIQLADAIGITYQQLNKYEHGANRLACARLWEIARVLRTDVGNFFHNLEPSSTSIPMTCGELDLSFYRAYNAIDSKKQKRLILDLMKAISGEE